MGHRNEEMIREVVHNVVEFKHEFNIKKDRNVARMGIIRSGVC